MERGNEMEWDDRPYAGRRGAQPVVGVPAIHDCAVALHDAASRAGLDYYLMSAFPRGDSAGFAENRLHSNWPPALAEAYAARDIFHRSRLVALLKRSCLPVFCDGSTFSTAEAGFGDEELDDRFHVYGLRRTFAFCLHDAELQQFLFAFSGNRSALSREEGKELVYSAMELLDAAATEQTERPAERLSRREIECLRWSAAGKSSEEIAIILSLSSHTVVSYLKSAMRKLDSVNRMQAVARAFRFRLI